jgi:hypothetical protein
MNVSVVIEVGEDLLCLLQLMEVIRFFLLVKCVVDLVHSFECFGDLYRNALT